MADTLAALIARYPDVVRTGMSVAQAKRALLDAATDIEARQVSSSQALLAAATGTRVWAGGVPATHVPVTTEQDAERLADALARYGNYPPGLSPCFAAGINGDADRGCPFVGEPWCDCIVERAR